MCARASMCTYVCVFARVHVYLYAWSWLSRKRASHYLHWCTLPNRLLMLPKCRLQHDYTDSVFPSSQRQSVKRKVLIQQTSTYFIRTEALTIANRCSLLSAIDKIRVMIRVACINDSDKWRTCLLTGYDVRHRFQLSVEHLTTYHAGSAYIS